MQTSPKNKIDKTAQDQAKVYIAIVSFAAVVFLTSFFIRQVETEGVWEWLLINLTFLFFLPFLTIKFIFREKLKEYYFKLTFSRELLLRFLVTAGLFFGIYLSLIYLIHLKGLVSISIWSQSGKQVLLFVDLLLTPLVIIATEFFFRGFSLKIFSDRFGFWRAALIVTLMALIFDFVINHYIFSDLAESWKQFVPLFVFNFLLAYLAYLSKSIFYSFLFSWIFVLVVDIIFLIKIGSFN